MTQIPESIDILPYDKIKTWDVEERKKYIDKILLDLLRSNPRGLTIAHIADVTKFYRRTISDHLQKLVIRGEVYTTSEGKRLKKYFSNGELVTSPERVEVEMPDGHHFLLFRLKSELGSSIYVQEKRLDDFRRIETLGGITIRDEEVEDFIKRLHVLAARTVSTRAANPK
jgi:hypothetical protein